jgi:hypothetical protein
MEYRDIRNKNYTEFRKKYRYQYYTVQDTGRSMGMGTDMDIGRYMDM